MTRDMPLTHALAEEMAQKRFTELMASAGVDHASMAKEVLFFLPRSFLNAYESLWYRGLGGKDDGGSNARGGSQAETAAVGKARVTGGGGGGSLKPGHSQGGRGARQGKRYKKYWVIADEEALHLKDRIDKRLRAIAREIEDELVRVDMGLEPSEGTGMDAAQAVADGGTDGRLDGSGSDSMVTGTGPVSGQGNRPAGNGQSRVAGMAGSKGGGSENGRGRCGGCGRVVRVDWVFCPFDGNHLK